MIDIASYSSIEALDREWDELANRLDASPFMRPGWIARWWQAFGSGSLKVLAARTDRGLEGVLPLLSRRGVTKSTSNWHTPVYAMLAENERARQALAQHVFAEKPRTIWLGFFDAQAVELSDLQKAAERARYRVLIRTLEHSPYLELRGDWRTFEAGLRSGVRTDLKRKLRRAEKQGPVELDIRDGTEQLDELLAEGFEIEASGWKAEGGSAISSRHETTLFYSEVARWAAERGWLRLAYLRLGGRAIAFQYALEHRGAWYYMKGGYKPAYRRFSPGRVLMRALLERCFADRLVTFEFLGGDEPYKLEWTSTTRDRVLFQAFPPSPAGFVGLGAYAYGRPLAKRARNAVRFLVERK